MHRQSQRQTLKRLGIWRCTYMMGRHKKQVRTQQVVEVDLALEEDLAEIERSVGDYLQSRHGAARRTLLEALKRLDEQVARSDAYEDSPLGSGALGCGSKGDVLGETSIAPAIHETSEGELSAHVALVKAAKNEVREHTPRTFAELRLASAALSAIKMASRESSDCWAGKTEQEAIDKSRHWPDPHDHA
jgi:hypothetical protein